MKRAKVSQSSIGLRVKTGRAIAVVLGGPIEAPHVLLRAELNLTDSKRPATAQPYHEFLDLPWDRTEIEVKPIAIAIAKVATSSLKEVVDQMLTRDLKIRHAGIVGAPARDLRKIGSTHIRAHAAEGVLFREVLETAAERNHLEFRSFPEREIEKLAASELGCSLTDLAEQIVEIGRAWGRPWRADEKLAAMAAWLMLRV